MFSTGSETVGAPERPMDSSTDGALEMWVLEITGKIVIYAQHRIEDMHSYIFSIRDVN
jgi:hypothetical protein